MTPEERLMRAFDTVSRLAAIAWSEGRVEEAKALTGVAVDITLGFPE